MIPGLVDVHIHGAKGHDFCDANTDGLSDIAAYLYSCGVTSFCATSMTLPENQLMEIFETVSGVPDDGNHAYVAGIHMEGPFLSPAKKGAQKESYLCNPSVDVFCRLLESYSGKIKLITIAPELPGAMQFGKYITSKGVLASVGHTQAEFEDILTAYEVGYTHATHFYNAMPGFHKRREYKYEGTVESIYLLDDMTVEVVADGIHVPPTILRLVYKIKGVERTCLITDALACAASDSQVAFDPRVIIEDGVCKLADRSALAGSVATMDGLIRTMVQNAEIPLADAVRMASETPARIMGVLDRKGTLERGKDADIIALDRDLNVRAVWAMGQLVEGTNKLF